MRARLCGGRRGVLEEERGETKAGIGGKVRHCGNCLFLGKVEEIGGDFRFFIIIFFEVIIIIL